MAIELCKGERMDLRKRKRGLRKGVMGLGWDRKKYRGGGDFELEGWGFVGGEEGGGEGGEVVKVNGGGGGGGEEDRG